MGPLDMTKYSIYQQAALNWFIRQMHMQRPASYKKARKSERQNRRLGRLQQR